MLAEYEGYLYISNIKDGQVALLTYDQVKWLRGFDPKERLF